MKIFILLLILPVGLLISAKGCESELSDVQVKNSDLECMVASDCAAVEIGCCSCQEGGKQRAINKEAIKKYHPKMAKNCRGKMCIQMISKDESCQKVPDCIGGRCELQ